MALSAIKQGISIFSDVDDTPVDGATKKGISSNWAHDHTARFDAHTYHWMQVLRTGELFLPLPIRYHDAMTLTADEIYAIPCIISRALTIDRLYIQVTTAGAAGKIARLGVYKDGANVYPGALVKDYGTVAVDATGIKYAGVDQALTKGLYWLVIVSDGAPAIRNWNTTWSPIGHKSAGLETSYTIVGWYKVAVGVSALADPFVAAGSQQNNVFPAIAPRLKSLD